MKFYNTLTRTLETFAPIDGRNVRMYTCGPTVYDFAHVGNFRAYVFEDLLRRYLEYAGFDVTQVMNLTDVDDKTIRGSRQAGLALNDYTKRFKDAFFEDLRVLNIERAEHYPAATDHVPEMIALIRTLIDKGYAYKSEDGSIYFSIAKFKDYGKLAHLDMSGLRAGARVAQDEYDKENAADFALWKAWDEKDGDVVWDSPWGRGRPGWHIECSAMSMKYLGPTFDIHTGGVDNVFPHHEDEIAQSESATGQPFARYWLHCGYLVVDGRKMSKSLGNFYTIRDILTRGYTGREVRYVLMSAQYRQSLNFTFEALDGARAALRRLDDFVDLLREKAGSAGAGGKPPVWAEKTSERFRAALENDLNVSEALAAIFDLVYAGNKALLVNGTAPEEVAVVLDMLMDFDRVFGFLLKERDVADAEAQGLVVERQKARSAKDWKASDRVRDRLLELGWEVRDTPEGPKLIPRNAGQERAAR